MFISIKSTGAYVVHCLDGELGMFESFHFDDKTWSIRYLVINTGSLLNPRRILLLPTAVNKLSWVDESIKVNLSKTQAMIAIPYNGASEQRQLLDRKKIIGDENLRCTAMTIGYKVMASDKQAGKVVDMILDDHDWKIKYLVVDTNGVLPLGDVLLSVKHVNGFATDGEIISIDISSDELKHCPKYDPNAPVNREYVMEYYDYEGRLVGISEKNVDEYRKLDKSLAD